MKTKALVLLNMGAARSKDELKIFLTNMFNDENILTIKNQTLRFIIAKFIVFTRLDHAWENYEEIGGKSPLYDFTSKLEDKLKLKFSNMLVVSAMRYTQPFAQDVIRELTN